tara:strand:+ start:81 stop:410 length:330 start_codon:yes stop_codon:yes gene_type:complete
MNLEQYKDIEKKIAIDININIERIKKGYDILEYSLKDDILYSKSKIKCFNGYEGNLWDIDIILNKDIETYLNNLINLGVKYNNRIYILDRDKFDKTNICEKNIVINMIV